MVLFDVPISAVAATGDVFIEVGGGGVGINLLDNIGENVQFSSIPVSSSLLIVVGTGGWFRVKLYEAGGASFVSLTDTPAALGTAGQGVIVNTAGDALEFADIGGGGDAEPDLFVAPIEEQSSQDITGVFANELSLLDANVRINRGGYSVIAGTNSQQAIEIPADGTYTISGTMRAVFSTTSALRNYLEWAIVVIRNTAVHRIVPSSQYTRSNLANDFYTQFNYTDDFEADDQIELRALEVVADTGTYTIGGENSYISIIRVAVGAGAAAQSAGSGLLLAEQSLIANKVLLDEYGLSTSWSAVGANDSLYFAGIHQDSVDRIELGFNISSHYQRAVTITGRQLKEIGSHSFPASPVAATTVEAIYVSGRTIGTTDSREPMLINPKYGFMEERRQAGRFGIIMFFTRNTSNEWVGLEIYVSSNEEIDLDYGYIIPRGAAA